MTTEEMAAEFWNKVDALNKIGACGATGNHNVAKINIAYEMFENFRAGRNLRYVGIGGIDMVPWLHRKRVGSKFWQENHYARPPFGDHYRFFVDKDTKQRIMTIQPYWPTVAGELGLWETLSQEFKDLDLQWNKEVGLKDEAFKTRPDIPAVQDTFADILNAAQSKSDEFAKQHGLTAKISFNGWYYPEHVILVEYSPSLSA